MYVEVTVVVQSESESELWVLLGSHAFTILAVIIVMTGNISLTLHEVGSLDLLVEDVDDQSAQGSSVELVASTDDEDELLVDHTPHVYILSELEVVDVVTSADELVVVAAGLSWVMVVDSVDVVLLVTLLVVDVPNGGCGPLHVVVLVVSEDVVLNMLVSEVVVELPNGG